MCWSNHDDYRPCRPEELLDPRDELRPRPERLRVGHLGEEPAPDLAGHEPRARPREDASQEVDDEREPVVIVTEGEESEFVQARKRN
jgi:hypothetical protein